MIRRTPGTNGRWPSTLLCSSLLLPSALVALVAPPPIEGTAPRPSLELRISSWVFPGRPVEVTLEQSGLLAGRHLAVLLFIDENQFERVTTKSDRTRVSVAVPLLAPGLHLLTAKAGTEVAATKFRVLPWSWLAGVALLALGTGVFVLWRRSLRRPAHGARPPR